MSQDNEYNEYNEYNNTLNDINDLPPLEEELLQYDVVSPFTKKLINTTRSAEEKLKLVESHKLNKELDIEGYSKGNIVSMGDADSGKFVDETGNIVDFRFADLNPIDAIDKQKARERSPYKASLQPKLVADLTGKSEKELTEDDYTNVANYQFNEMFNSLSNKDYKFNPYDKSKVYEKPSVESIPFAYKIVGEDKYGRKLVEAINPETGRQISFDMSNNPYLNSSFDLYKSIDSDKNRNRLNEYISSMEDSKNKLKDIFDTDGRLGEDIDIAQSVAYQSAARVLQHGPNWLVDKKKWESIANAKTGKALADAWAGVKTSTRREYATEMAKSTEDFAKGDYISGIIRIATQFDRMLAESATQNGLMIGGAAIGGTIATIGGAPAAIATGVAALSAAMLAAVDSTLEDNEEYKVNNNGKSMPTDELLKTFAVNTALVIPETLFAGLSINKFIPKKLAKKFNLAYKSTAPTEAVKTVGGAALGEGLQEIAQDTFNEYMSQDQSNPKSLTDIATSPEMAVSGVAGALMGAGLSSVPSAVGAIRTARIDNRNNKIREDITTNNQNITVTGSEANTDLSNQINNEISNTTIDYTNKDAVKNEYLKLKEQANNPDISTETLENIKRKQTELLLNHIKTTDDKANRDAFLKATGKSKEEAFDEIVYFSDLNAQKLYEETGKRATEARKKEVTKELLKVAELLDVSEDYAKKSFNEVQSDIRFGAKGYYTYRDKIIDIDNKLQDTSLSQEDIDKLNNDKGKLLNRLNYLYNNQVNKLEKFAEAVEKISEGNTNSVTFDYPSTKGSFTVHSSDLATNLRGATKGAFSVIEGIEGEIKDISDIIFNHASKEQLTSLDIGSELSPFIVKSISDRISNAATNIRNRSKSAAAKTITGKPKDMSKVSNKDLISKLHKVGSGEVEGKSLANLVGYLRNISTDKLEEVRQKTLNSKLSKEQKDIITKGIDTIINTESTTVNETTAIEDKNNKLTKQANDTLNNITDNFINTSDTNTLLTTVNNLRKLFLNIQSLGKKDNDELLKRIVNKGKQINKKYKELTEKESNKVKQNNTFINHSGGAIGSDTEKQTKKDNINIWYSSNENAELSNLAERPFTYNGKSYRSVEHAYQTLKSGSFDEITYNKYLSAKKGSKITGTKSANTKNNYNIKLMEDLIKSSFEQNPEALQILLNTGNKIITHTQDKGIWNKEFPRILTKVREELRINDIEEAINNNNNNNNNELKNTTTKSLLDKNSNSSVTLGSLLPIYKIETINEKKVKTQIRTSYFDLNQELKVDENTTSVLAKEGVDTALLPEILHIADRIKFNPYEIKGINNYFNYLLYKTNKAGIMAPNGLLSSSPHFRLLYNMTQEERVINGKKVQGLKFEYNPITLFAVDLGVKELLTNTDLKSVLNPTTRMDLASTFGMDESTLSTEDISKLKNHIKKYGVPKTVLADRLGKLIIHNLGLKANLDEGTIGFYERISTGLGMYAISYAAQMGYLTESRYEANKDSFIKYSMTCIRKTTKSIAPLLDSYLGRKDEKGKRKGGLRDRYKVTNNIIKTPRTTKSKLPHNMTLRHTNGLAKIPSFTKSVLEKLWNTSYEMDLELVDFIKENIDALKKRLSYLDKESINLLTLDSQHSAKGVNLSIDDQFKYLFDYAEVQKEGNKFYFDWFESRNGRIFIDSNTLNPQTSKSVQRFVCLPSSVYRDFDPTNQNHIDAEYFAIAQAFDSLGTKENIKKLGDTINSLSLDELLQLRSDLVNMDKNAFKNKYESKGIEGIENYGQCLNVLQHLIRKKQTNGKPFKTWLAIENDSTTSGYFIRLLQFCNPRILKKFGEKVGIILASNKLPHEVIHELKKLPGFLDIYKTMALDASKKLPDTKNDFIEYYTKEVNEKGFSLDALSNTFIKMYDALPKPTQEGVVDSALRTLLKSPSMIFGYTAGENSIVSKVSLEIMEEFISTYNEIVSAGGLENYFKENKIKENSDTAKKLTAIRNTMQYLDKFSTIKGKSIIQQLKDKSSSEVWLNIQGKKITLDRYFVTVLGPTYGKAIWDSLSESFKEYIQYNDSMNYMAVNMFAMFKSVLDKRLQDIKNSPTNIRGILISERNKIIESLSELLPTLPLFYSNNRDEGMLLMKTGKIKTSEAQVQNPRVINGKLVQESTSANIYDFTNPGKGGAVLPIHFIDGMMAMMTLSKFNGVIPVHDAFVMSALDNKSLTQGYNQFGYALNKDFNLYETMVNRFIEVVKEYDKIAKKEGLPSSKDLTLINGLNKEVLRGDNPITIDTFVKEITKLSLKNNKDRELFYNSDNPVYITNMDGIEGSGIEANVNTTTLPEIVFKEALEKWRDYSGPKEYVTDGEIKEILQEATDSVKARVDLFDKLQELSTSLGNKVENKSHLNHLKDLIRRIDIKKIKDTVIEISKNRPFSSGMLNGNTVTIGFDDKVGELDSITKLSPFSDKSAAEIYAHELVHAAMRFALANGNTLKIKSLIDQILKLQLAAKKVVTWEDFMPSTYDSNLKEVYEENAKRIYDYIFNNSDIKNLKGLHEFIAYGLTNENLMNKLKQHYVPSNINSEKESVLDKLIKIGHTILNIVFGNKRISDLVSVLADVTGSTLLASKRNTLYKELDILTNKIIGANNRAVSSLQEQISKPIEQLFKLFADLRIKANKIVSPKLHTLFNLADMKGKTFEWLMNPNGNMFNNTLRFLNMLSLLLVSKSRRRALKESIIAITGISQQNAIMSLLRDLEEPDLQSSRLELITMLTRNVEQSSKSLESITARELLDAFDKPLKEEEKIALTQSALFTDLSSLLDDHDIKYIKKVLSDNTFRTTEINKILAELQNEKYYLYYKNQAYGLARFMVYGLGNSMQNLNAENIARGLLTSHHTNNVSDKLVKNIDKLTTLYAIGFTANKSNKILANLDDKGLTNFLITHKNFVKESKEGIKTIDENGNVITTKTITDVHTIKGYTKQLFDSTYDIKIDFIRNEKDLAKEGYSLVSKLKNNNITETNDLAIYRRTFSNPNRRNGAGFILSGTHAIGSTLKDTAFNMLTGVDIKDELAQKDVWDIFKANINKEVKKFDKLMHTKDMTFEDFEKLSSDYTPIVSPTSNKAVDYRITMSTIHKQKLLNMNMNGISILSKMYASQNTKLNASIRNKALIKFLKDDVENNMIESTKRGKDTGIKYVLLDKNTDNKYLRESWKVLPEELKEEIEKGDFYIREDWLQSLFGIQDISLTDWSVLKKGKTKLLRRSISIAEYILKTLAYIAKRNIVLLVPGVLVNNIISNINYSIMNGANPAKVAKMQLANAKAIRTYLEDKKALNRIEFRERIGTATKEEVAMKNIYKSKLQNNIVHPLMEKGMYQSIVEDINIDDLESIGKISKFLKNSKLLNKIPNPIRWVSRQLYMTEGTPIYDFMFQATQYSDFIARATEYQLQMDKAPKKYKIVEKDGKRYKELTDEYTEYEEKVTIGILNAFINYDKPQSSIEQYLNDIGLIMFTKFAKRIQHVILKSSIDNPIGVLMFLLGQHYILDTDDILEQNIINKHWTALIYNPVDNFINATVPILLQYKLGIRNTGL